MLLQGTNVRSAVLDPLGAELDAGPELYFTLLRNLGKSFRQCLDS
jgi:zinc transport system substrate-binding protein